MIQGKVAKILNEFQLVLNVGAEQGVRKGMDFVIFEQGMEVENPDGGDSLGRMELVKGEVTVSHVQDKMSIAQSKEVEAKKESTVLSARLAEVTPSAKNRLEGRHEKLYVRRGDISGIPSVDPIKVGDSARSVEE